MRHHQAVQLVADLDLAGEAASWASTFSAKSSIDSSMAEGVAGLAAPGLVHIDVAGGAGAGAAAVGVDARDVVLDRPFHDRQAGLHVDDVLGAVVLDVGDLGHETSPSLAPLRRRPLSWKRPGPQALSRAIGACGRMSCLPDHELGRSVDRLDRLHEVALQVEDGELRRRGVAAHQDVCRRRRQCRRSAVSGRTGPTSSRAPPARLRAAGDGARPPAWPAPARWARSPGGTCGRRSASAGGSRRRWRRSPGRRCGRSTSTTTPSSQSQPGRRAPISSLGMRADAHQRRVAGDHPPVRQRARR